jgi:hypothetical protein
VKKHLLILALLALGACTIGACTIGGDHSTNLFNSAGGSGSGGLTGPSGDCSGQLVSISIDVEAGISGGAAHVGTPLTFSADPRDAAGNTIAAGCLSSPATFAGQGVCPSPIGGSLGSFTTTPSAAGTCTVIVTFLGKTASASVSVVP